MLPGKGVWRVSWGRDPALQHGVLQREGRERVSVGVVGCRYEFKSGRPGVGEPCWVPVLALACSLLSQASWPPLGPPTLKACSCPSTLPAGPVGTFTPAQLSFLSVHELLLDRLGCTANGEGA